MAYGVMVVAFIILVILLRKRIIGGIVGILTFVGVLALCIFILDWYSDKDVRDYADVTLYDQAIQDPIGTGEQLAQGAYERASEVNQYAMEQGAEIDTRLGIETNAQGVWVTDSDNEQAGETEQTEGSRQQAAEQANQLPEVLPSDSHLAGIFIPYEEIRGRASEITPNKDDQQLLRAMTPHHITEVEGTTLTAKNTEHGVVVTLK